MSWQTFKIKTEKKFKRKPLYSNVYGWQIQPGTKWNPGLTPGEINDLESLFGFDFPTDYKEMLSVINGFDRDQISIDPEGTREDQFGGNMYTYPRDYEKSNWLTEEILEYINYTKERLSDAGFDVDQLIGFVPLYAHRALAVFKDKSLSPVISVHQGTDVIIYGHSLMEYWKNELK
ncbi:MAG TPA: SMI1/KNR4 family protein [Fluviicola sp.]|nr:SMI1/KNR4 family protein [Fluviicola sp.]